MKQKFLLIAAGFFLGIIFLEIILRIAGLIYLRRQEEANLKSLSTKPNYIILALGESTTAAGGISSWPSQLEKILNSKNLGIRFSVINKGKSGTNSYQILSELEKNLNTYHPDMVITMMGINEKAHPSFHRVYDERFAVNIAKPPLEATFLDQLRVYKLAKLLWATFLSKMRRITFYGPSLVVYATDDQKSKEDELKQAILDHPEQEDLYLTLAEFYEWGNLLPKLPEHQKRIDQAENTLKQAIQKFPTDDRPYLELGILYFYQERYKEAEELYQKALQLDPRKIKTLVELSKAYRYEGKYQQAIETINRALGIDPQEDSEVLFEQQNIRRQMGENQEGDKKLPQVLGVSSDLVSNYRTVKDMLNKRSIQFVAVQYPVQNIEPLKQMLGSQGVIYIDNERVFKDALKSDRYEDLFVDRFAGDFGHATTKGNYLLASNIAKVILKEVFGKE